MADDSSKFEAGPGPEGITVIRKPDDRAHIIGPPLGVRLSQETLDVFRAFSGQPRAAIRSPIDAYPKPACEDHALNGVLLAADKKPRAAFAVVADGISHFNLHAARGSALACLAGFQLAKQLTFDADISRLYADALKAPDSAALGKFLRPLVTDIWAQLVRADSRKMKAVELADPSFVAPGWEAKAYETAKKSPRVMGYGTTMLFAYHDGGAGFVFAIGDGGVITLGGDGKVRDVLGFGAKSSDAVNHFLFAEKKEDVLRGRKLADFEPQWAGSAYLRRLGRADAKTILLSDGPEETCMLHNETPKTGQMLPKALQEFVDAPSRMAATDILRGVAARKLAKIDDHGAAVLNTAALQTGPR